MKKVFIIHGFGGMPNGGWLAWLAMELGKSGIYACALPMPNPSEPIKEEWINLMNELIGEPNENIFLVGHSLGGPAVLKYLESLNPKSKLGGVLLVSSFIEPLNVNETNSDFRKIDNFVIPAINFENIKNIPNKMTVIHGQKDTVVPFSHSKIIAEKMNCELVLIPEGDHFSQKMEPICYELPEALEALLKITEK